MVGEAAALPLHFTPTSASWINLVERWFPLLTERQLRRGVHPSVRVLKAAIRHYFTVTNTHPTPLTWTKTAGEILASVARLVVFTMCIHLRIVIVCARRTPYGQDIIERDSGT